MSRRTKHVVVHTGSPREDLEVGYIIAALAIIIGGIVAINAIIAILPFLVGAGVISAGGLIVMIRVFSSIKFKLARLVRLQKKIQKSRDAESRTREMTASLEIKERELAANEAQEATKTLVEEFEVKKNEVTALIKKGLDSLSKSRESAIKNAKDAKSSAKFNKGLNKIDGATQKLNELLLKIEKIQP